MTHKIIRFIFMNKYEKHRSWVRNTYNLLHKRQYGHIGKKSYFLNPMFISGMKYMYLADDVGIWDGARVEMIDFWEGSQYSPRLVIGNHVNIGQNLHLTCAEKIVIEDNVVCSARVTIIDNSHETNNRHQSVLKQGIKTKPVRVCEGAFIGANVVILPGVTIGKHSIIGAGSIVTKDVPDYCTAVGAPARVIKAGN